MFNTNILRSLIGSFPSVIKQLFNNITFISRSKFVYTFFAALLCLCMLSFIIKLVYKITGKGGKL